MSTQGKNMQTGGTSLFFRRFSGCFSQAGSGIAGHCSPAQRARAKGTQCHKLRALDWTNVAEAIAFDFKRNRCKHAFLGCMWVRKMYNLDFEYYIVISYIVNLVFFWIFDIYIYMYIYIWMICIEYALKHDIYICIVSSICIWQGSALSFMDSTT